MFWFSGVCKKPCQNGGTCIGGNKCSCPEKYHGQHCMLIKKGRSLVLSLFLKHVQLASLHG